MDRQLELFAKLLGEYHHLVRLDPSGPAHAQRVPDHDLSHVVLANHSFQRRIIQTFVLTPQGCQSLCRDAQWIRDSHSDGFRADVQSKDASRQAIRFASCVLTRHPRDYSVPENLDFRYDTGVATETIQSSSTQQAVSGTVSLKDGRKRDWPQAVIAFGVILFLVNQAELVLVVMMVSILLAFILSPLVDFLQQFRMPRSLASFTAVIALLALIAGAVYVSYAQASSFIGDLPKYSAKIRQQIDQVRQKAETWENSTDVQKSSEQNSGETSHGGSKLSDLLSRGFGSLSQGIFAASFVPFLVYFMLSWAQHTRSATVMLFRMENRHAAYVTLGLIAKMMRSFMVGNLLVGLFMAALGTIIFGFLDLPFFYFVGPLSGFLSLVPYLGVVLAMIPPIVVAMDQSQSTDVIVIIVTVFLLHVFSLNVLYPKFLGNRLQLNPLAVTISLLFWGWLWGAMGLVLAIPLTGAIRIVFDHVQPLRPYGAWLGE